MLTASKACELAEIFTKEEQILRTTLENIEQAIKDRAHAGCFSVTFILSEEQTPLVGNYMKVLRTNGYIVVPSTRKVPSDKGDPDSGEGKADAYFEKSLQITWTAA